VCECERVFVRISIPSGLHHRINTKDTAGLQFDDISLRSSGACDMSVSDGTRTCDSLCVYIRVCARTGMETVVLDESYTFSSSE